MVLSYADCRRRETSEEKADEAELSIASNHTHRKDAVKFFLQDMAEIFLAALVRIKRS